MISDCVYVEKYRTRVVATTLGSITLVVDTTFHTWLTYQVCAYNAAGETCTTSS